MKATKLIFKAARNVRSEEKIFDISEEKISDISSVVLSELNGDHGDAWARHRADEFFNWCDEVPARRAQAVRQMFNGGWRTPGQATSQDLLVQFSLEHAGRLLRGEELIRQSLDQQAWAKRRGLEW